MLQMISLYCPIMMCTSEQKVSAAMRTEDKNGYQAKPWYRSAEVYFLEVVLSSVE